LLLLSPAIEGCALTDWLDVDCFNMQLSFSN
jgi:hypothetical protein